MSCTIILLAYTTQKRAHEKKESTQDLTASKQIQVDDLLRFSQFSKGAATGALADDDVEVEFGADGEVALGGAGGDFISDLKRVVQLTGFSDPIYAEALVKMVGFDIMLGPLFRVERCLTLLTNTLFRCLTCEPNTSYPSKSLPRLQHVG